MSYLEVFGVLTGVGVDVSKIFGVGAGAESESEKCDSAHLWWERVGTTFPYIFLVRESLPILFCTSNGT